MDLDDFWQENKRWILGCMAGLLVFLIAKSIIGSTYGTAIKVTAKSPGPRYQAAELQQAKKDKAALEAQLAKLRAAMHYDVPKRFVRDGDPDLFWTKQFSGLRKELFSLAYDANVEFPEASLTWQTPRDAAGIDRGLVGLSLVEHTVKQLMAAHKATTEKDADAIGLRSIGTFAPDRYRAPRRRPKREGDPIKPEELLSEVKIGFKFEADNATVHRFFENCRDAKRRVTIGSLKITHGRRTGDPLTVSGEMIALTIGDI